MSIIQKQLVTVKAIFENKGKILLLKDHKDKWELPGGRIEFGESPQETIKRELIEELFWKNIEVKNLIDTWSFMVEVDNINYQFIVIIFSCLYANQKITHCDESASFGWFSKDEIRKLNIRKGYIESIKKYFQDKK